MRKMLLDNVTSLESGGSMYRMLIVEDEEIEREGLRDLFDWNSMGIDVVGAVESGEDAIDFASENDFDILFTDIKLTGMTGLELAGILLKRNQDLKVIISSGFRDFEYARTAVDLDAYGYLSKPIEQDELNKVIIKVLNSCKKESSEKLEKERLKKLVNQSMPFLKSNFFNYLLHNTPSDSVIAENLEYFNIPFTTGQYIVLAAEIDDFENYKAEENQDEAYVRTFEILECINSYKGAPSFVAFHISEGRFCIIINTNADKRKHLYETILSYVTGLQKEINEICKLNITIGIGRATARLAEIKSSYREACKALEYKFFMGANQIINYLDITCDIKKDITMEIEEIEKKLLSSVELCDRDTLNESINLIFTHLNSRSQYSNAYIRNVCINLIARTSILLMEMHESYDDIFGKETLIWEKITRFENIFDIQQWFKNIFNVILDHLLERKEGNNKKIINDILKIIEENYSKNLTIMDISNEVYLSPNYISIIFKKEIGESFTDYLVKYRLEKAKRMLKETSLKVYQIGSMVGYSNISYFCSIFKNYYGVSPSEYREKT